MGEKYTPGPWMAASHPSSVSGLPVVARPSGRSIASVTFFHLGEAFASHDAESNANARLIAAAPALLEALERCRRWMPILHGCDDTVDADKAFADAAIAAAKGEQP